MTHAESLLSHSANIKSDYMLRNAVAKGQIRVVFGDNASNELLHSPIASPLYGDYTDLPPVFISASDTEVLFDDSRLLFERLKSMGHKSELDIQHGVCHAFQAFTGIPEARITLQKVFGFLGELNEKET